MNDPRIIQAIAQRTRPSAEHPDYARQAEGIEASGGGGGGGTTSFPAKIVSHDEDALYTVRQQSMSATASFSDKSGTSNITAVNLAELTLGDGGGVDDDEIVSVHVHEDGYYYFDHPVYAKYL